MTFKHFWIFKWDILKTFICQRILHAYFGWDNDGDICFRILGFTFTLYKYWDEPLVQFGKKITIGSKADWRVIRSHGGKNYFRNDL